MGRPYKSLNDAARYDDCFLPGPIKIWYVKEELLRVASTLKLDPEAPEQTHVLLGSIMGPPNDMAKSDEQTLEYLFNRLQAVVWSPRGEARPFIVSKKVGHTDMAMYDAFEVNGEFFVVDSIGYTFVQVQ